MSITSSETAERSKTVDSVAVLTDHPVAVDSPDHLSPWGTARDNSKNSVFNAKIYSLYPTGYHPRVLDLGCSGGGFVRECIDDGCLAVGIEGSDYSKRMSRAEWGILSDKFLFTADITKPFTVVERTKDHEQPLTFDVITSWEVLEHIADPDLTPLCENIRRHLKPSGLFVASVSPFPEVIDGVVLHQTVQEKPWWLERFAAEGLTHLQEFEGFFNDQYVRGPRQGAPGSFHVILSADPASAPAVPKLTAKNRMLDRWIGSRPFHIARALVGADR